MNPTTVAPAGLSPGGGAGAGFYRLTVDQYHRMIAANTFTEDDRAQAGIPVYWIVNLQDGQIEVYTDPDPAATPLACGVPTDYRPGQGVPVVLDAVTVAHIPAADLHP